MSASNITKMKKITTLIVHFFGRELSKYKSSEFFKNVLKLFSANIVAQSITLLTAPILTRLYSPDDFGVTQQTDCYDPTGLVFSFDRVDMNVGSVTFDCDDVGASDDPSELGLQTPLYAFENSILVDSCINIVTVIEPFSNCPNGVTTEIEGKVFTAYDERVEGVEIFVTGDKNKLNINWEELPPNIIFTGFLPRKALIIVNR